MEEQCTGFKHDMIFTAAVQYTISYQRLYLAKLLHKHCSCCCVARFGESLKRSVYFGYFRHVKTAQHALGPCIITAEAY